MSNGVVDPKYTIITDFDTTVTFVITCECTYTLLPDAKPAPFNAI